MRIALGIILLTYGGVCWFGMLVEMFRRRPRLDPAVRGFRIATVPIVVAMVAFGALGLFATVIEDLLGTIERRLEIWAASASQETAGKVEP